MLTAQIAAYGKPVLLALNMVDEALARGIAVNAASSRSELGVPVIEMVAIEGPRPAGAARRAARRRADAHRAGAPTPRPGRAGRTS